MILETVTVDWRCKGCGSVRRIDVTDVSGAVYVFRPAGWKIDRGEVKCDLCTTKVTVTDPDGKVTEIQGQRGRTADELRGQMDGMHIGGGGAAQPDYGIRQPPPVTYSGGGGASSDGILRDHEGKPVIITGGGGENINGPQRTYGAGGGGADAQARPSVHVGPGGSGQGGGSGTWAAQTFPVGEAPPMNEVHTKEFRPGGGNVAFVDTRNSEFLGPEKIIAGVPSLTAKCIGCHMDIQDGTTSGTSEPWRLANDSTFERGHLDCLAKMGR